MTEKRPFKFTIFDTESLEDNTDNVEYFEFTENLGHTYAWITTKIGRIGLCNKRENPRNKVYSIKMWDDKGNTVHRMMEVADEIQNGIPVILSDYAIQENQNG